MGFFEPRGRTGDSEELAWRYRRRFAFNRLKLYICDYATMRHDGYVLSNVGQYSGSELLLWRCGRQTAVYPIDIEDVKSKARRSYFGLDHLRSLEYSFQSSRPLFGYIRSVQTMMASATRFED